MWGLGFPPAFHLSVQLAAQVDYTSKRRETFNPKVLQFAFDFALRLVEVKQCWHLRFYDIQLNIKSEKGNDLQTIEDFGM